MKLVVFSDVHGKYRAMERAAAAHPNADMFVFLGDGLRDAERALEGFGGIPVTAVRGNCDIYSDFMGQQAPAECLLDLGNIRVMCMHGHLHGVKYGISSAAEYAKSKGADLLLYGHTHICSEIRENGVVLFNPGSVAQGSYGIVYVEQGGILCSHGSVEL